MRFCFYLEMKCVNLRKLLVDNMHIKKFYIVSFFLHWDKKEMDLSRTKSLGYANLEC